MRPALTRALAVLLSIAAVAGVERLIRASAPQVPSNTWLATGSMAQARGAAAAALLPDGRVLLTGGLDANGRVTPTAERYSPSGGAFLATPPMQTARANHSATLLADGRVLVAGGTGADGRAVASSEIYDPATNSWAAGGSLNLARRGHTATLLAGGAVLVAGGDDGGVANGTVELFDPASAAFTLLASGLSSPRTLHAAALLGDGRVLLAGGFDGASPLASTDLYDPRTGAMTGGPSMAAARSGLTLTALLDGRAIAIGGAGPAGELATAEVFDPASGGFGPTDNGLAAARQNHLAFRLPHNNQVLVVGGIQGGSTVQTAEVYTPWEGSNGVFCSAAVCASGYPGPGTPTAARPWAAGSALSVPVSDTVRSGPNDGLLLQAGGTNQASAELYGFATIRTDKADYAPGTTVTITGSGFVPGESVALMLREFPLLDTHPLLNVTADANGNIVSTEFVPDAHDVGVLFSLTAFGQQSQAQTSFSDSANKAAFSLSATGASINSFGTIPAASCQSAFVQAYQGSNLGAVTGTVALSSSAPSATFFAGAGCTGSPISSLTFTNQDSAAFSFSIAVPNASPYTMSGDASWANSSSDASASVTVNKASQTITVTTPAPASAAYGSSFAVGATASSGLAVAITATGGCSGSGSGSASITMTSSTTACVVHYNQAGNASYNAAVEVTSSTTATKATVTPSVAAANKIYDGTTTASTTCSVTGVAAGDAGNVTCAAAAANFIDKNVGAGKTVNATGITLGGSAAGNYQLSTTSASTTAGISTRAITVTAATNTKIYDGTTSAAAAPTVTTGSLAPGDTGSFTETYDTKAAGTGKALTPTGSVSDGNGGSNYAVSFAADTTGVITAATVTGSFTASDKTYDGTNSATIATRSLAGVISPDVASLSGGTATFADKNVGTGKTVTGTGFTLAGADAGNYQLSSTTLTATASITPKSVTPSVTASDKIFDGTADATIAGCTLAGVVNPDTTGCAASATAAANQFSDRNVGAGKTVTASNIVLTNNAAGNYALSSTTATTTASITAKPVTASVTAAEKVYDGTKNASITNCSLSGVVSPDTTSCAASASAADNQFSDRNAGAGKTVTASNIALTNNAAGNYTLSSTSATTTASIGQRPLTVSASGVNKVYDGTTAATVTLADDRIPGDSLTDAYTSAAFADKNVGPGKAVSVSGISATGADSGNYALANTSAATTAAITSRALTVTAAGVNKVYDGNTSATVTLGDNRIVGDVFTDSYTSAAFADKNVGTGKAVSVSGIAIAGTDAGNYAPVSTTAATTADISGRPLTIAAAGIAKIYDGTTLASVTLSDNRVAGDVFTDAYASATFGDKSVGTAKPVSVSGIAISGTDAGNYTFNTTAATTADITARALTITATGVNKVFDGTTGATVTLADDRVAGDIFTDSYAAAAFADANAGTGKAVSVTGLAIAGADAGNYTFNTTASTTADITPRTITVTADDQNKTYGDADPALTWQVTSGALVAGTWAAEVGADAPSAWWKLEEGSGTTLADSTGNGHDALLSTVTGIGYGVPGALADGSIGVSLSAGHGGATVASPAGVFQGTAGTVEFWLRPSAAPAAMETILANSLASGVFLGTDLRLVYHDAVDANVDHPSSTALVPGHLYHAVLTVDAGGNGTWYLNGVLDCTFSLGGAPAGFVADRLAAGGSGLPLEASLLDELAVYGTALSPARVGVHDAAGPGRAFTGSLTRTAGQTVAGSPYPITKGSLSAGANYDLTFVAGALTIAVRPVTPAITAGNKTYDGTTAAAITDCTVNKVGTDDVACSVGSASFDTKAAGTGKTVTGTGIALTGADAGNYVLSATTATTAANIDQKPVTPAATVNSKIYDGTTGATLATCSVSPIVSGDDVACTGTATFADKNAGLGKTVSVTGLVLTGTTAGNYTLTAATASTSADINARALTVTATASDKVYDGTKTATISLTDDRVSGDALSLTYVSALFADKNVGAGKAVTVSGIAVGGADGGNYVANTTAAATASITQRPLTVTATGINKTYDGNTSATVTLADNHVGTDIVVDAYTSAAFADRNAGTGKPVSVTGISIGGGDSGNYALANTTASTTADITGRGLTVTATGVNKVYDGTTTATVTLSDNRVSGDAVTDSYAAAAFADKAAGVGKPVSVTGIGIGGADAGNYTLLNATATASASITQRGLVITAAGVNKVYDGTTAATVTLTDNRVPGDVFTDGYGSASFANPNAGLAKPVTVTGIGISGADAANYSFNTSAAATADIAKATPIFGAVSSAAIVYAASPTALSGAIGAPGPVVPPSPEAVTVTVDALSAPAPIAANGTFGTSFNSSTLPVGPHTITYSYAGDGNFNAAAPATGTLTVSNFAYGCDLASTIPARFNDKAMPAGRIVWFNNSFVVRHVGDNGDEDHDRDADDEDDNDENEVWEAVTGGARPVTFHFDNQKVTFNVGGTPLVLNVPDAQVVFTNSVTQATTTFDAGSNTWVTKVPARGITGRTFASALAYTVPAPGLPGNINPVTWTARITSDTPGLKVRWRWGAATYTQFATDYNTLGVKATSDDRLSAPYLNRDRAGTPENFKAYLAQGARSNGHNPIGWRSRSATTGQCGVGTWTTFTQTAWAQKPDAKGKKIAGALLTNSFGALYSGGGVAVGGGFTLTFTSADAIEAFLPTGGKENVLQASAQNPKNSKAGVFAGQVLALRLNVDFSNAGVPGIGSGLANLVLVDGPLAGRTVQQVLDLANAVLGGNTAALPAGVTLSRLNDIVTSINENFDSGQIDRGFLLP